jgi:hypothetical protein
MNRLDGQTLAPLEATRLEHIPPIGGFHALAKSMHTLAMTLLGLIRSFWHGTIPLYFRKQTIRPDKRGGKRTDPITPARL